MSYLYQKLSQPSYSVLDFVSTGVLKKLNMNVFPLSPLGNEFTLRTTMVG